ncbi:hypothetical protein HPB47_020241 [Ixodes persulcatus]|uniref:Uncharacterized protein n=1 Tax=Ixodes persulcatus TaxID=34615 RepID=A0AC60QJG9_IXOPE|nr:hypothetical protein HPB47_020241 [Ixodes persulcatus]
MGVRVVFSAPRRLRYRPRPVSLDLDESDFWAEKSGSGESDKSMAKFAAGGITTPWVRRLRNDNLVQVDFEVWGDVQALTKWVGEYFGDAFTKGGRQRKKDLAPTEYARDMCQSLGVRGWIKLTNWGTVVGSSRARRNTSTRCKYLLRVLRHQHLTCNALPHLQMLLRMYASAPL